ncbi:MAG: hypothetical protein HCA25_06995 [Dolichospermum sp. DET50]|nr:hypothetical protein [Dolichospermum sp. DET66]MBS3032027.1 hypothetical protein [Dolichospermum sp. DET67]MBS3037236.1 hypothetical protein [Dolichospermum sp. DET50]QSX69225.1 MAG: hypothetical protein EZY12_06170 [Dolichospermum sp. DET69]
MSYQNKEIYKELNASQECSESDTFTCDRYRQFFHHIPIHIKNVLDIGCNTGRGGKLY